MSFLGILVTHLSQQNDYPYLFAFDLTFLYQKSFEEVGGFLQLTVGMARWGSLSVFICNVLVTVKTPWGLHRHAGG